LPFIAAAIMKVISEDFLNSKNRSVTLRVMHGRPSPTKVIFLGDTAVGKTNLMNALTGQPFSKRHVNTTGPDLRALNDTYRGSPVHLQIWDTAGQEMFRSITRMYLRNAGIVLVCYDMTARDTFANIGGWIKMTTEEAPKARLFLIGTKKDLTTKISISLSELESTATQAGYGFAETSSLTREGVEALKELIHKTALEISDSSVFERAGADIAGRRAQSWVCR
jgi:small GTP-binding protein